MAILLQTIKDIVRNEVNSQKPAQVLFGTVTSEAPLKIAIDQWGELTSEFLILSREVTDYDVDMTVDHVTEDTTEPMTAKMAGGGKDPSFTAHQHLHKHTHPYKGRKTFRVHKRLLVGEKVILIRVQGGQKYLVLDRVGVKNDTNNG